MIQTIYKVYVMNSFPKRQKELQAYLEEQGWNWSEEEVEDDDEEEE